MKAFAMTLQRAVKYNYLKILRVRGTVHALSLGAALGIFFGLTPTMPLHTVLIIVTAMLTRSSAITGILSSWIVCNPFTYIPIYYLCLQLGNKLTPYELSWQRIKELVAHFTNHDSFITSLKEVANIGFEAIVILMVGGIVLGLPIAIVSYYLFYIFFNKLEKIKHERRQLNKEKRQNTLPR